MEAAQSRKMFKMVYKFIFVKDGLQKEFRADSYNYIRNVHNNMKHIQKLPYVGDIQKPKEVTRRFFNIGDMAIFKKKKSGENG